MVRMEKNVDVAMEIDVVPVVVNPVEIEDEMGSTETENLHYQRMAEIENLVPTAKVTIKKRKNTPRTESFLASGTITRKRSDMIQNLNLVLTKIIPVKMEVS